MGNFNKKFNARNPLKHGKTSGEAAAYSSATPSPLGYSPLKQTGKYHYTKATKDYTSPKEASYKREKQITKEHNSNYPHAFKAYTGLELTKPE